MLTHVARVFSERAADAKAKAKANAASPHANADADAAAKANANAAHAVVEQCLGALTALCLRHPENAARCGAEGVFEPIVECMAAGAADYFREESPKVEQSAGAATSEPRVPRSDWRID